MRSQSRKSSKSPEGLRSAREACRRGAWGVAYLSLARADQMKSLEAHDLELLATAAYLTGRDLEFCKFLDRAYHKHVEAGDRPRAARSVFWSGLILLFRGEAGQASALFARARRLIDGVDCVEHGCLLLPEVEKRLGEGQDEAAYALAQRAAEFGDRFADADLSACSRHLMGRARLGQGRMQEGLTLLDEAMLAAVSDELSPIMTGLIYCSVIGACQEFFAMDRAREWTSAFSRWCDQQKEMVAFTGTCLVHRAQIMELQGAWSNAMTEARRACEPIPHRGRTAPAAAFYRKGEMHRLRGEIEAAEEAYRTASQLGCEPQPGLALLRLHQGRTEAAGAAMRRIVGSVSDPLERAKLLPAHVEIMLAAGDIEEARNACSELEEIAAKFATDVLQAMASQSRGAVSLAEGQAQLALAPLRRALELWQTTEAPYEAARVRVLMGRACRSLGDEESASLEMAAARSAFERLGAAPELSRVDATGKAPPSVQPLGLTRRELEILRLIASGKTNKAIAAELFLSERTIDRHVSNILCKLDVSSRAAATACAYEHKLL